MFTWCFLLFTNPVSCLEVFQNVVFVTWNNICHHLNDIYDRSVCPESLTCIFIVFIQRKCVKIFQASEFRLGISRNPVICNHLGRFPSRVAIKVLSS